MAASICRKINLVSGVNSSPVCTAAATLASVRVIASPVAAIALLNSSMSPWGQGFPTGLKGNNPHDATTTGRRLAGDRPEAQPTRSSRYPKVSIHFRYTVFGDSRRAIDAQMIR
jgi:hypothetical protein